MLCYTNEVKKKRAFILISDESPCFISICMPRFYFPATLAHESFKVTVRLNTNLSAVLSLSGTK